MIIKEISAKKILNSRNEETIEVIVDSDIGKGIGRAPSGKSTSSKEVKAFPQGVSEAVNFVNNTLSKELINFNLEKFDDFKKLENLLKKHDKSEDLNKIGGNLIIALEFAMLNCFKQPWKFINPEAKQLPRPLGNVIGGGAHVKGGTDFQEFLLTSFNANDFSKSVDANNLIHKLVKKRLGFFFNKKTDEGAWAPNLTESEILDILSEITRAVSKKTNIDVKIGLDVAASNIYNDKNYVYKNKTLTRDEQIDYITELVEQHHLVYVEDPLEENDFKGFNELTKKLKSRCFICGDDLIATNPSLLKKHLEDVNAVIVKPNQIGSLIKTKEFVDLAKKHKITTIISHRSGETMDATISQLAVGFNIPFIKCGISGPEREIKFEELKKIEKEIKDENRSSSK